MVYRNIRDHGRKSKKTLEAKFHKEYGSSSFDLAQMWFDLCRTDIPEAKLKAKDQSESGFKCFLVAHHFLWTYPKNADVLADNFNMCEKYARGKKLWKWVAKIAALKGKKIVWNPEFEDEKSAIFIISIDGTDFRIWETKHATLPIDRGIFSKKFNHGAVKYEIAIDVNKAQVVWINGPFRGGKHDMDIYRQGLQARMPKGKLGIVDNGYKGDHGELARPNPKDPKPLRRFKSRARLRQETFNGRLKKFNCLENTFRHGVAKHKLAFEAVCVTVQYQMDNGAKIYAV